MITKSMYSLELKFCSRYLRDNTEIRLIIVFAAKNGEALYSQQKQDRELTVAHIMNLLLIAKFRLKLKKVEKTTRPFRYDLNQITYNLYRGSDK